MDQKEVLEWLVMLPSTSHTSTATIVRRCVNDFERIQVLHELLIFAGRDRMSDNDAVICLEALQYLEARRGIALPKDYRRCEACKKPVELTIEGHRAHVSVCCKSGRGARGRDRRNNGKTVTRCQAADLPSLQTDIRDGFQGVAETHLGVLPNPESQGADTSD